MIEALLTVHDETVHDEREYQNCAHCSFEFYLLVVVSLCRSLLARGEVSLAAVASLGPGWTSANSQTIKIKNVYRVVHLEVDSLLVLEMSNKIIRLIK
jgi:hypothetical protein